MWIVRLALRRPYTFVVMALLIVLGGIFTATRMPTDIFPEIDIPVVAVIWQYAGLTAEELEKRVTGNYERALTTTVNGIEHIESQTINGVGIVKIFFHPGTRIEAATAQVTAISQTILKQFPPGITPPFIMQYSASNVPVIQGAIHSETIPEQSLFDLTTNFLRTGLATVQGAQMPWPYGGKQPQIMVDIDLARLHAHNLSPSDVSDALNVQNLILPSGTVKLGTQELNVRLNSSADAVREIAQMPIRTVNGATVTVGDVAQVRDGFAPQTSVVRQDERHAILMPLLKSGGASTLDIVSRVRAAVPGILKTLPVDYKLDWLFDQSVFVRASVEGVVKEAVVAAFLTGLMILLFLGSWRGTVIVVVSIPLSIFAAVISLGALGHSLNLMTLGGLSLAVGILVDDATVEIENVHRNIAQKKPLVRAILDGAQQIATPAFVATLCTCIVFVPVAFIAGAARSLFTPLAMAVVFAMLTSYFLSRTLVPTMVHKLLGVELHRYTGEGRRGREDVAWRIHERFGRAFERFRRAYGGWLDGALEHRVLVTAGFGVFVVASCCALYPALGRDFFPSVDAGQMRFHVRGPPGMRIEETERRFGQIEEEVRKIIPKEELATMIDNIGVPVSGINLTLGDPSMISAADGEILISLREGHRPTAGYIKAMRGRLAKEFPDLEFFWLAPDITTQVLNFGLSAPIDVQVVGPMGNQKENLRIARALRDEIARVPGAVDVHLQQVVGAPALKIDVDRLEASQQGLTPKDVAGDLLVSLSSSGQVAPNFWLDPAKGVQYLVAVQTPQYKVNSLSALQSTPVAFDPVRGAPQLLANVATIRRDDVPVNITHYNVARTIDVLAGVQETDLGSVAAAVDAIVAKVRPTLPRGSTIVMRGQVQSMQSSFRGLAYGLGFAVLLVYFLMVVNFQSWLDPLIILTALPGALAGICWILFSTRTTLSVPALMGAIMSIGVATSNSILLVTFANDQRAAGVNARKAAWLAGVTRLRPVLMTALAMILGMLPMAIGLGEGGEQNAPLGRAVIGGLALATFATLFFVPVVYSAWRKAPPRPPLSEEELVHAA
jgi:multidrug efflux pump subunit AcrB